MGLHHVLVPESVTRVITGVFQLHVHQIEAAVVEDANLRKKEKKKKEKSAFARVRGVSLNGGISEPRGTRRAM